MAGDIMPGGPDSQMHGITKVSGLTGGRIQERRHLSAAADRAIPASAGVLQRRFWVRPGMMQRWI
jgi:hypothetical protein